MAVSGVTQLVAVAACVLLFVTWSWSRIRSYVVFRKMEMAMPGPLSVPLIGSAHVLLANKSTLLEQLMAAWGGRCSELTRLSVGNHLFVFVTDADHLAKVMRDRRFTDKPGLIYSPLTELMGDGVFLSNGSKWQQDRTMMTPTFHQEVMDTFFQAIYEEAQYFVDDIAPTVGHDLMVTEKIFPASCKAVTRTTLASTVESDDLENVEFISENVEHYMKIMKSRSFSLWWMPEVIFQRTSQGRHQKQLEAVLSSFLRRLISRKTSEIHSKKRLNEFQSARKLGFKEFKSLLDMVVQGMICGDMDLTQDEILTATKTMFTSAVDSPVIILSFFFKIMSIQPDIQERVYNEIKEITENKDHILHIDDLPRLEYLGRVIKETLRMFPVAPLLARQCNEDCELAGKQIPAGTVLLLNVMGAHRDPRHHPDPLHFDPDRFLPERADKMHPFCYLPFSAGPRNCIGQPYAVMFLKTFAAVTLQAYRILPTDDGITCPSQFPLTMDVMLRYVKGVKVRFERR